MAKAAKSKGESKTDKRTGRPTKLTPDVERTICNALALGATQAEAAKLGGISDRTLLTWLEKGEAAEKSGETEATCAYLRFRRAYARARSTQPDDVLRTLADEKDWRARAKYVEILDARRDAERRHANADLQRRKLEAECDRAEAEARRANAIADGQGGAAVMVMPEEALRLIPEAMRPVFAAALRAGGVGLVVERDLCAGVTPEDVAAACPGEG